MSADLAPRGLNRGVNHVGENVNRKWIRRPPRNYNGSPLAMQLDETLTSEEAHRSGPSDLAPGRIIDRYEILAKLGEGGMGLVYEAFDLELQRRVAFKVLRYPARGPAPEAELRRSRLVSEARALARLSHENVVQVFDAGTVGDEVFVVMELVDGERLSAWLDQRPRRWEEVLDVFTQAGRGLLAAHRAGLVHRDVKPSNMLVGADGRVRVLDFGLAIDDGRVEAAPPEGTPGFIAPETLATGRADALSDQYSFARSLAESVRRSARPPPAALTRVLSRAQATEPTSRYTSLEALLHALARVRAQPRRRRLMGVGLSVALVSGTAAFGLARGLAGRAEPCAADPALLAGAWDGQVRERLVAAFRTQSATLGETVAERAARALDDFAARWQAERLEGCRATRQRAELSEELWMKRLFCLGRAAGELRALTGILTTEPTDGVVRKAVQAVGELPDPAACGNVLALQRLSVAGQQEGASAERLRALRERIDRAAGLRRSGEYAKGLALIAPLLDEVDELADPLLRAEVVMVAAELEDYGGDAARAKERFEEAAVLAGQAGDSLRFAQALTSLVFVSGIGLGRHEEALALAQVASGAVALSDSKALAGQLANHRGAVLLQLNRLDEATRAFEEAISLREVAHGKHDPRVASSLSGLGAVRRAQGRMDDALALHERALEIKRSSLGDLHPEVAQTLGNMAAAAAGRQDFEGAKRLGEQALEILRRAVGQRHYDVGIQLNNLGSVALEARDYGSCARHLEGAVGIFRERLPPTHAYLGRALMLLGECYVRLKTPQLALPLLEESLRIHSIASAGPPEDLAHVRLALARALWELDRQRPRALSLARAAINTYRELKEQRWLEDAEGWLKERAR